VVSKWAQDVVDGKIISGELMRLAAERHLRDLVDGPSRGLFWSPERAAKTMGFFPAVLKVTAGAKEGEPFNLPSYTGFTVGSLFGWHRPDGRLRFRTSWVEAGKGQIKSPVAAAIGLYTMGWRGVKRAECYAIAKDRNQANVLFGDATAMANAEIPGMPGESLVSRGDILARGTGEMTWMLEHPATRSKFRALAGDEKISGPRPTFVAADEIHDWKTDGPLRTWRSAGAKMPGDFLLWMSTNTPAADQLVGTEYSEQAQALLRGEIKDDASFAIICRVDEKDDPFKDEKCWVKAMPCLGITFPVENVRIEVNSSKTSVGTMLNTKRLYFGIPVGASEYWIDVDAWQAVQDTVPLDALGGKKVVLAIDLSQKNDLTCVGAGALEEDGTLLAHLKYWKPKDRLAEAAVIDSAPYVEWEEKGLLNTTPGMGIDYDFVAMEVQKLTTVLDVVMLVFDPAHITEFRKACDRIGFATWIWTPDEEEQAEGTGLKMVIHGQGRMGMTSKKALWMPRSVQKLEDRILKGKRGGIMVDEHPITHWCAANTAVQPDPQGNRFFIKKKLRGRIDGTVVLAMLCGGLTSDLPEAGKSYLEKNELLVLS
jgi:phage terminase large subunit-like protein